MKLRIPIVLFSLLAAVHCGDADAGSSTDGLKDVADDDLNGLWITTAGGVDLPDDSVIESWSAIGIRLHDGSDVQSLTRSGNTLTSSLASLTIAANKSGVYDDTIDGTLDGQSVHLRRDVSAKPTITLAFPGDRPFRSFLTDLLVPAAQQDRESYVVMHSAQVGAFLHGCELYKHGSWQSKYLAGATFGERDIAFAKIVSAIDNLKTTPRELIHEKKFAGAVMANLKDASLAGLALSTFSMYFSTAAGRSIHLEMAPDATAYFITDRPTRAERIGVVAMQTPLHATLASTFGRQLLDMGAMPATDDPLYARTMMELLATSDNHRVATLSPTGRSALTDWFAVMAIEDYRGVAFGMPDLGWGYNMTNAQFYGLVVRALGGQVIVGSELRPGDPSYADVLNGGSDMQEYPDMAALKTLATDWLRANHSDLVAAVESAFANVVPKIELDYRAQADVFHYVTAELYDAQGRTANLTGASAGAAIDAVTALFDALAKDATSFEAYVLAHGITKSAVPAPKSTGY